MLPESLKSLTYLDITATAILAAALVQLIVIDLREFRLPNYLTVPLIALGLLLAALRLSDWPVEAAIGATLGFSVFWLIGAIYFRLRGIDGLGQGDAKLLAAAGAWLGPLALPWVVLLAAVGALAMAVATGRLGRQPLAFGPWLAGAFWVLWIFSLTTGIY